ncbi:MAG: T9SS type A sorting domain-containing protein [Ferruginibacter sp.]
MKKLYPWAVSGCRKSMLSFFLFTTVSANAQELMRANLYVVDPGVATLVDGNLTNYNNIYSNAVDVNDAWKMENPGINFGLYRAATNLVVERRSIYNSSDTSFFRMWNLPQHNYRIKFMLKNLDHPGMYGSLIDNFLHTETAILLNDTTYVDFTVNSVPGSASEMRFQLIYGPNIPGTGALDVNITSIQAAWKGQDILVQWNVVNEESIEAYTIEHSTDGRKFNALKNVASFNTPVAKTYNYTHNRVTDIANFYRIKALSKGGRIQYSSIARINPITSSSDISIYPNPISNKTAQVQFMNLPAGKYNLALVNSSGTEQKLQPIQINGNQSNNTIILPANILPGIYQLQFTGPDKVKTVKTIMVL